MAAATSELVEADDRAAAAICVRQLMARLLGVLDGAAGPQAEVPCWPGRDMPGVPVAFVAAVTGVDPELVRACASARQEFRGAGYFYVTSRASGWKAVRWVTWSDLPHLILMLADAHAKTRDRLQALVSLRKASIEVLTVARTLGAPEDVLGLLMAELWACNSAGAVH